MSMCNRKIQKLLTFFVCFIYYKLDVSGATEIKHNANSVLIQKLESFDVIKRRMVTQTTHSPSKVKVSSVNSHKLPFLHIYKPLAADGSPITVPNISNGHFVNTKEEAAKLVSQLPNAKADKREAFYRPSLVGSIFIYLITLVVAGSLFVMLACFMHKWRENIGSNTNYPKVEYSMLRQGEDEPEDPMGEILVNIGLALPEDIRHISDTESETDDSKMTSMDPSIAEPAQPEFVNIPLYQEDSVRLLLKPSHDESDEELLQ